MSDGRAKGWRQAAVQCGVLVVLSFAFRFPALLNASLVNADAAVVGIQARHILHGEWGAFLYGSGYQTSVDSFVAALFFGVLGSTPLALVLSTLTGHVVLTCVVYATLRRHLSGVHQWAPFVAALPLVFTSAPLHTYVLSPPRQASLTLVFLALFVMDGASTRPSDRARLIRAGVGGTVASLACFADPYALLFLPALALFGCVVAWGTLADSTGRPMRVGVTCGGMALGLVPWVVLLTRPEAVHGETTFRLSVFAHNFELFWHTCLPWLVGAVAFVPNSVLGYVAADVGSPWRETAVLGGAVFVMALLKSVASLRRSDVPRRVRLLGAFGTLVSIMTVVAFLFSTMVMDLFSSRYLVSLVLVSPFTLAPLFYSARLGQLSIALAPYLFAAGMCGWLGYGNAVDGPRVVSLAGHGAEDEMRLEALLEAKGVRYAVADYWVSYRLTFLYGERIAVVPLNEREDRYRPYRQGYRAATRSAYVFDPERSREKFDAMKKEAFEGNKKWGTPVEEVQVGSLTAVVFDR